MASFEFDASSVPVTEKSYEVLPAGWYTASITGAEPKSTKSGTGKYLRVEYTISGPTGVGRKVWSNYNVRNENPKAESIGREQLAELCRCVGLARVNDTDELLGCNVSVKLKVREASNGYEAQNEVQGHKALEGSAPPAPAAAAKAAPAKAGPKPPWAK
jgi:hypothetical protein